MKKIIVTFTFLLAAIVGFAQKGTIRVTVFDDETGEPLIGANVVIANTTIGSVTDLDGKASIDNLSPGSYELQISYVSYQTQMIQNIQVVEKEPKILSIRLDPERMDLDEVVIQAEAIRTSENALLTIQKKSLVTLDAISSDQFSRNGDSDAAAAIKRVTGVSVEGGKHVIVRGLGDRYSKTNLNGSNLPGLDPNKNSVQFDIFPSNLIDNIIVYKTFSPEFSGDFTGGLVNIQTKDFPDRFTMQFSGSLGYNTQASFKNNFLSSNKSSTDWLGFDDGLRAMPDALKQYNSTNFPAPFINNQELDRVTKSFSNVELDNIPDMPFLNQSFSFSLGNQHSLFQSSKFGYVAAISYARDFEFYESGFTGRYSAGAGAQQLIPESLLNDSRGTETVLLSGLLNTTFLINNSNKIKINTLINQSGINVSRNQEGLRARPDINPNRQFESRSISYTERSLKNIQVVGEHSVSSLNNLSIHWQSSYTVSAQDEPDVRFFANNINIQDDGSIRYGFDAATSRRPSRYFRELEEDNFDNKLDFVLPLKNWTNSDMKIKFGGAYTTKDRLFREDRLEYFLANTIIFEDNVPAFLADENLGIQSEGNRLGHYLSNVTELRNNFDAEQTVSAGYMAIELPLSNKFKFNGGLRLETTDIYLESFDGTVGQIQEEDLLPAAGIIYELTEAMNIRSSYSRTIARPTFREIAPLATFDFIGDFFQLGNPNLERSLIDNLDLRWEIYPRSGEYIGVSAFYKNFTNPIENTIIPQSGSTDGEYKFNNVDQADLYGIELEVRKTLDFIASKLENFRIGANVTFIKSQVDINEAELAALRVFVPEAGPTRAMYNQSPYVINANLQYDSKNTGWSANATYNVFGERLAYVATTLPYVYEQPRPELNVSLAKSFNERLRATLRATNLLNPDFKQTMTFNGEEYIFQQYNWGRTFSVGISYIIE